MSPNQGWFRAWRWVCAILMLSVPSLASAQTTPTVTTAPVIVSPHPVTLTHNQQAVSNYLNALGTHASGDLAKVLNQFSQLSPADARRALNQMSGEHFGAQPTVNLQATSQLATTTNLLLRNLAAPGATVGLGVGPGVPIASAVNPSAGSGLQQTAAVQSDPDQAPRGDVNSLMLGGGNLAPVTSAWIRGYGIGGNVAGDGNTSGYNFGVGGTVFGVQQWVGDTTLLGVLGGYSHTVIDTDAANTGVNSFNFGLYGKKFLGNTYLQAIAAYSHDQYNSTRSIEFVDRTASGSRQGNDFFTYWEAGCTYTAGNYLIRPYLGLQYILVGLDSFTESGAASLDLNVPSSTVNSLRSNLGGQVVRSFQTRMPLVTEFHGSWMHEYLADNSVVTTSFAGSPGSFTVDSARLGFNYVIAGTSVQLRVTERLYLFGEYDFMASNRVSSHAGSGGLQFRW